MAQAQTADVREVCPKAVRTDTVELLGLLGLLVRALHAVCAVPPRVSLRGPEGRSLRDRRWAGGRTWIMGLPAIITMGFPGNRVEP